MGNNKKRNIDRAVRFIYESLCFLLLNMVTTVDLFKIACYNQKMNKRKEKCDEKDFVCYCGMYDTFNLHYHNEK